MDVKNTIKGRARQGAAVIAAGAVLAGAGAVGLTAVAVAAPETSSPTSASTSSSATSSESSEPSTSSSASPTSSSKSSAPQSTPTSTSFVQTTSTTTTTTKTEEPAPELPRPFYDALVDKDVDKSKANRLVELEGVICENISDKEKCAADLVAEDGLIDDILAAESESAVREVLQEAEFGGHKAPPNTDPEPPSTDPEPPTSPEPQDPPGDGDGDDDAGGDTGTGNGDDNDNDAGGGGGNGDNGAGEDQTRTETRTETQTETQTSERRVTVERNTTRMAEPQTLTQRERIIERRTTDPEPEARDDDRDEPDADATRDAIARDRADRATRVENPNARTRSTTEPRDAQRVVGRTTTERADAEKEPPLVYADASDEEGTGLPVWGWGLLGALLAGIAGAAYMLYDSFKKGGATTAAGRGRSGAGRGTKPLSGSVKKPPSTRK